MFINPECAHLTPKNREQCNMQPVTPQKATYATHFEALMHGANRPRT